VFICGISALPPVYLKALKALGKHIDIHISLPTLADSTGVISRTRWLARLVTRQRRRLFEERSVPLFKDSATAAQLFDEDGIQNLPNPLLASWGNWGVTIFTCFLTSLRQVKVTWMPLLRSPRIACCIIFS
jgi:exodeoxyribonuclease V gamma subunit